MEKEYSEKIFSVYKEVGETPYQVVQKFRQKKNIPPVMKVAYAGRLDPMAEGLLLLVLGRRLRNFDKLIKKEKEYEADILFGFSTDSYDILGIPQKNDINDVDHKKIKDVILNQEKIFSFELPPFSSYKVQGKPLFYWARENKIQNIARPVKKVKINELKIIGEYKLTEEEIHKIVVQKINKVNGNFRQKEILKEWNKVLKNKKQHSILKIKINCDSGFYVRSFAEKIGKELSIGAVLFHLKRTKIGEYNINNSIKL